MEDFPVSLSPATVGVIAMAIPFIALAITQGVKGAFYWWKRIPAKWKASLPDKVVWMGLAGAICIGACLALKLDVGASLAGNEWPTWLPWWLSAIVSGILLTVLSSKVLYPALLAPASKATAQAAVAAACARVLPAPAVDPPTVPADPIPAPPSQPLEPPPATPTPPAAVPAPTARLFLEVHQGGPDRFVLIEDGTGQHIYPCS